MTAVSTDDDPNGAHSLYTPAQRWGFLAVLFCVSVSQFFDRSVISVLLEPIKAEFKVSDALLGLLSGLCFALFYTAAGLPLARWADRGNRRTVITLSLAIWSVMTIACGLAQSFWQLALARVGVGAGEAGGIPPSQSLLVDYFPARQRATVLAIFTGGSTAGNLLGLGLGGYVAAHYGWRAALLWAGAAGIVLSVLVRFTLSEPRLKSAGLPRPTRQTESLGATFAALRAKRSFAWVLVGWSIYLIFVYGALVFVPSFLVRSLHLGLADASLGYGLTSAAGSLVGTLGGGWLADRLARRDVRWFAWLPAVACALTGPIYLVAFATTSVTLFMVLNGLAFVALAAGVPSLFAAIHAICGSSRRATAIALIYFSASLVGGGLGPLLAGALSDAFAKGYGQEGLRYALLVMTPLLPVSCVLFWRFGMLSAADQEP